MLLRFGINRDPASERAHRIRAISPNDYRICAVRKLIISTEAYTRMQRAVGEAVSDRKIYFIPRDRLRLVVLSDTTVRWAARRSNCFNGMSVGEVYDSLLEARPASAANPVRCFTEAPVQPWDKQANLAVKFAGPNNSKLEAERSGLFTKVCTLSGVAIHGIENYPSATFARFNGDEVPQAAIDALNEAHPDRFTLTHLDLIPILNSAPQNQ